MQFLWSSSLDLKGKTSGMLYLSYGSSYSPSIKNIDCIYWWISALIYKPKSFGNLSMSCLSFLAYETIFSNLSLFSIFFKNLENRFWRIPALISWPKASGHLIYVESEKVIALLRNKFFLQIYLTNTRTHTHTHTHASTNTHTHTHTHTQTHTDCHDNETTY